MGDVVEIEAARNREYAARTEDAGDQSRILKKILKTEETGMLMKIISDSMGRIVVGPIQPDNQLYTDKGIAAHVAVENVGKGADFEFRCNTTGSILFSKTLAANVVMIYFPRMAAGHEYELRVSGGKYGQINKIFREGAMCPMTRIRLTERVPTRKVGFIKRIFQTIGW